MTILDSNGKVIGKLQHACNTDATQSWKQANFGATSLLASHTGETVTLVFSAQTASSFSVTTAFFIDDVEVAAS